MKRHEVSGRGLISLAVVAVLGASVAGCEAWKPPAPPPVATIPIGPDPAPVVEAAPPPPSAFAALRDRLIDRWLADEPAFARGAGLHAFDGKIADYSAAGIAARLARVENERAELRAVDRSHLTADEALDLALLEQHADATLFWGRDLEQFQRSPMAYEELFSVNGYLDRDYAPIAERAERLLAHEEAALAQVANIEKNLAKTLSKPIAETGAKVFKGYADYLRHDVKKQLEGVGTAAFKERLARVNEALAEAAIATSKRLEAAAKKGDESHVLGPARYLKLLEVQEGLHITLAELGAMGEENLRANKQAYDALVKKKVKLTPVPQAELFDRARRLTTSARAFILEKKLVTLPSEEQPIVKETPPFQRWNAAFLDWPGVFEQKPLPAYYYLTLPDPSWSKKEQAEYLMPRGILLSTTIHEVYPGHFLQGQWLARAPTRAQKLFMSYSFVEGWAHYGEQLMIEEGFHSDGAGAEDESRLGQLSDALLRNCRVVVSLGVHTAKMTMAQAARRFVEDCHQDKATAREQAARAAFDPGYFAYTLGKIQILALRDEAKKRLGPRFSLQKFHDALLSHGAPPVPLLRDRVLHDIGADAPAR
jgi:uncharacterized protein (DUF885 family)